MRAKEGDPTGYQRCGDGLFSSSLDGYKQVGDVPEMVCRCRNPACDRVHYLNEDGTHGPWETPAPTALETSFRHSGWSADRSRVFAALRASGASQKRLERFAACGASAYVEFSPTEQRHRVRGFYCGDRFCVPCQRSRAARGRGAIVALAKGSFLRLITLTRVSRQESLTDALNHLLASFKRLRDSQLWAECVKGGVGVVEVKVGSGSDCWHVHLHLLTHGFFVDQRKLSTAWHRATGDSYVVDVRAVKDEERGVSYVCKYLGKGFDSTVLRDSDRLRECVDALRGRRLLLTFGDWYNRVGEDLDSAGGEWRVVGGLHGILLAAERGEHWARAILLSLRTHRQRLAEEEGPAAPGGDDMDPPEQPAGR